MNKDGKESLQTPPRHVPYCILQPLRQTSEDAKEGKLLTLTWEAENLRQTLKEAEMSLGKTKEQNLLCISSLCTRWLLEAELVLTHRSQQGQHSSLAGCSGKAEGDGCAPHGAAPWAQKTGIWMSGIWDVSWSKGGYYKGPSLRLSKYAITECM